MFARLLRNRITAVWFGLIAATLISWLLGVGHELGSAYAGVVILVIAFTKVHFVGRYFMEIREAPVALAMLFEAWVLVVGASSIGLFLLA